MRVLMVGDVVGRPGRRALAQVLPTLRETERIDLVLANGENAAGGRGLTLATTGELFSAGVDVITSGNHIWDQKEIIPHLDGELPILRPLNYPSGVPGHGYLIRQGVLIVNLMGRIFLGNWDCPFRAFDALLKELHPLPSRIIVDFHAEATSEKVAFGWYADGRASAVLGTHTHIGTVDARLLTRGTAYVSDVGMVGPLNSVIGVDTQHALERFLLQTPTTLPVAEGPVVFNAVVVELDDLTGKALSIARLDRLIDNESG